MAAEARSSSSFSTSLTPCKQLEMDRSNGAEEIAAEGDLSIVDVVVFAVDAAAVPRLPPPSNDSKRRGGERGGGDDDAVGDAFIFVVDYTDHCILSFRCVCG